MVDFQSPVAEMQPPPIAPRQSQGLSFNFDGLIERLQTNGFETLSPAEQELLYFRKENPSLEMSPEEMAKFVVNHEGKVREDPLYRARVRKAEAEALKAENESQGLGIDQQGWERYKDPESGEMRMRIIPGGPAERAIRAQNKFTATAARTVIEDANRADEIISPWTTGIVGQAQSAIPSTPANVLASHLASVKSNVAVDQLLNIKKSGAGLGQVPQSQLEMLSELLGVLKISLPDDVLRLTLHRTRDIYSEILAAATEDDMRLIDQAVTAGPTSTQSASPATPPATKRIIGGQMFELNPQTGKYVPTQ